MQKKIGEIKEELEKQNIEEYEKFITCYQEDARSGVQKLVEKAQKALQKLEEEKKRMYQMFSYERMYEDKEYICGIDEAGRGPLAGPVVAAAVILPKDCKLLYLNDSKKLSAKKREELFDEIMEHAVAVGVGYADEKRIDEINILNADYEAMQMAIKELQVKPDILLNDAVTIPNVACEQVPIIKGDAKSASIAAASIIAKVTRDRLMLEYDKQYPEYGFASNKGYGSKEHIQALQKYGITPIHRHSFLKNFGLS